MAGQTKIGEITDGEYDDVLRTISATPKGRSFLTEYRRRGQPDETSGLIEALGRIESAAVRARKELKPERIADELMRIGMTLELAGDGAESNPEGDEAARRMALVERARRELVALAKGLGGEHASYPPLARRVSRRHVDDLTAPGDPTPT